MVLIQVQAPSDMVNGDSGCFVVRVSISEEKGRSVCGQKVEAGTGYVTEWYDVERILSIWGDVHLVRMRPAVNP